MITIRPYAPPDRAACLHLFDTNTPVYFAPNERADYEEFLNNVPAAYYLCTQDDVILAAFGLWTQGIRGRIQWIMVANDARGTGVGGKMMDYILAAASKANVKIIDIAASQKSAAFFAHYGAVHQKTTTEGWGPGLDRVDMILEI